jgi:hypothetical protein
MPSFDDHDYVMGLVRAAQEADDDLRQEARDAHLFINKKDGQWEPYWWNQCKGKPRMTFDMTSPVVDQIAGEMERADFGITVDPLSGGADKESAKILNGLVRNIQAMSNATHIFNQGSRGMVTSGLDGWRVVQKFVDGDSVDQDLAIEPISNFLDRVWFDSGAEMQDRSDARWATVMQGLLKDDYDARWPEGSGMSVSENRQGCAYYDKPDLIMVGELLYKKPFDRELVQMDNGQVLEVNNDYKKVRDELQALGIAEKTRRTRKSHKVYSRFYDASGWLEDEKETVFSFIPVVPIYGNFSVFENKTVYYGAVRALMDYQRSYNYSKSEALTQIALSPRPKIPMTPSMMEGHTKELAELNVSNDPVLPFNPDPQLPGYIPQQGQGAQVNAGLATFAIDMENGIARAAGFTAANMGESTNQQSGVAIKALQDKSNIGTTKYWSAREIATCHTGRILIDAIPRVYDSERTERILDDSGSASMVVLNESVPDEETGEVVRLNDLSKGKYDVVCSAGASFQNKQQETVAALLEMAQADPSIILENGDILFGNIDAPGMNLIAERKRDQLFVNGMIPESQMTEEELEELQQSEAEQAQQGEQPDPMMVAAQAAMGEAQAAQSKVDLEREKAGIDIQIKQADLQFKAQKQQLDQQKQELDFAEKQAKLGLTQEQFDFNSFVQQQQLFMQQQKAQSDAVAQAVDNLNKQANTLKTIREAAGVDSIVGPGNVEAYIDQAEIVQESQESFDSGQI